MFQSGITYQKTVTMVTESCCDCGVVFGMPSDLQEQLRSDSNKWFYCPNGHRQHYSVSTETKLRKELEAERNRLAQKTTEIIQLEDQLVKEQRKAKRLQKRVANGVCPCCNRTFKDLANHIQSKHPEYKSESK